MSPHDDHGPAGDGPLGEHGFPGEADWLDLPMPELPEGPLAPEGAAADAGVDDFVSRVLRARDEDRQLDAGLARLDQELPKALLQHFAPPPIGDDFVESAVAAIQLDRQRRWRALLARYVAPEPSPEFVNRTLDALFDADAAAAVRAEGAGIHGKGIRRVDGAAGTGDGLPRPLAWQADDGPVARRAPRASRWLWPLAAAAAVAAAVLWSRPSHRPPFELQVALGTPADRAWADAVSPLPTVLAAVASAEDSDALFDVPVAGLWLAAATESGR
ncbi:MAG: hypothetical protein H6835_11560 [Planctomycetes bacterium]|nr:hypothetical protein [Planctomycetota bacterium]